MNDMKRTALLLVACACAAGTTLKGGTFTWLDTPPDTNWNTTSMNWNDGTTSGTAWIDDASAPNNAILPHSSNKKMISIPSGTRYVYDLTLGNGQAGVSANNYTVNGPGLLSVAGKLSLGATSGFTVNAAFGGESVRIGGANAASRVLYYNSENSAVSRTYLEDAIVYAPKYDTCFGPVPSVQTECVFVTGGSPAIFANATTFTLHQNRTIKISDGATVRFGINGGPFTINGLIAAENSPGCDHSTNSVVSLPDTWQGLVVFDPGEGRTNSFGRLLEQSHLKIASGVTHLTGSPQSKGIGTEARMLVKGTGSYGNNGNLQVSGGELYSTLAGFVDVNNYGQVSVADGRVNMPNIHWLNGLSSPAKLTVADGGEFIVNTLRLGQSQTKCEVFLNKDGLICADSLYLDAQNVQCDFNFNGGTFRAKSENRSLLSKTDDIYWTNVRFLVGEYGANFDTGAANIWWSRPLVSNAASDGGVTVSGSSSHVMVFRAANAYNGATSVKDTILQVRKDDGLPSGTTLRLDNGRVECCAFEDDSQRHTVNWISRVEGSGDIAYSSALHITNSIAPIAGGTLRIRNACDLRGDYEVSGTSAACGCIQIDDALQDISGLSLKVSDFSAFDRNAEQTRYQILDAQNGYVGVFTLPADWPEDWKVKYTATGAYLMHRKGMAVVIR